MACCNKKSDEIKQLRKLTMLRLLEVEDLKVFNNFKGKDVTSLTNPLLLDYHRKTHMLFASASGRRPINQAFIDRIIVIHNRYVDEILKRGMTHSTPLKKI